MNIETKIGIGDQVYIIRKITKTTCPIRGGTGKINLCRAVSFEADTLENAVQQATDQIVDCIANNNVKAYDCPECGGKGVVKVIGQKKSEVIECKVVSMQLTIGGENIPPVIMYSVIDEAGKIRKLAEEQFYTKREDADHQCFILNLDRREVALADIHIPRSFATTMPCNEKMNKRLDEWRKNRKFETEIYVDADMNLFDGYTSYLVYKMLGIENVPVVVWNRVKTNKAEKSDAVSFDKYKYYHSGNQVITVSSFAGRTVKGIAKCDPHDTFSLEAGKKLAALKCNNKITAKRLKRASLRYVEAENAVVSAQKHAERMERYCRDAKTEHKEAADELFNLLMNM